jgi:hypothetical protein
MECPVCYESKSLCNFTCGHSLCYSCTKSWYNKGTSTCPMCRGSMCFKGLLKLKKQWHREKCEEVYKEIMLDVESNLQDDYIDVLLQFMEVVQNRYEYTMVKYPNITCGELNVVLRVAWIDVDSLMNNEKLFLYEPQPHLLYLFINGTEYGVKNLSHTQPLMKVMSKYGKFNSPYATDRC